MIKEYIGLYIYFHLNKSREVFTNDGIITQTIFNAAVPTSSETK